MRIKKIVSEIKTKNTKFTHTTEYYSKRWFGKYKLKKVVNVTNLSLASAEGLMVIMKRNSEILGIKFIVR